MLSNKSVGLQEFIDQFDQDKTVFEDVLEIKGEIDFEAKNNMIKVESFENKHNSKLRLISFNEHKSSNKSPDEMARKSLNSSLIF